MILCSIIPIIWYANKYHSFSPFLVLEKGGSNLFLQYFERPGLEYFSFETTIFIKSKQLTPRLDAWNWARKQEFRNSDPNSGVWSGMETESGIWPEFPRVSTEFHARLSSFPTP
jgi:hypothetical protein